MTKRKTRRDLGSVDQIGPNKWRVRVDLGWVGGKRHRPEKIFYGSRREAEAYLRRMLLFAGKSLDGPSATTVAEWVEMIWRPSKDGLAATTLKGYDATIRNYIVPLFSDVLLRGVKGYIIAEKLRAIEAPGARLNAYKMLSTALKMAVAAGEVDAGDPMFGVPRPALPEYRAETYSVDELRAVLAYVRDTPFEVAVLVAAFTGLRRSELVALDWTDLKLDDDDAYLEVRRAYHGKREGMGGTKTARSARLVSIPRMAAKRLLEIRGENVVRLGAMLKGDDGQRMRPDGVTARWRSLMGKGTFKRADGTPVHTPPVRYIEWKNLRHTHATLKLEAGVDIVTLSRDLGHANLSTTDRFYLKPKRDASRRAADAFSDLVGGGGEAAGRERKIP